MFNFDKNLSCSPPPPPPSAHSADKSLYVTSIHFVLGTAARVPSREPGANPPLARGAETSTQPLRQGWTQDYSTTIIIISSSPCSSSSPSFSPTLLPVLTLFSSWVKSEFHCCQVSTMLRVWAVPQVPRAPAWRTPLPDASGLPKVPLSGEQEPLHWAAHLACQGPACKWELRGLERLQ